MHFKMAEKMEQFSITNRKMHKQLFKTLVVQITVPTFTIFMPVMFMFLIPFFDLQLGIPTGVLLCALSLYPFIDGLIVISIVSDYRKAAIGEFRLIVKCCDHLLRAHMSYNLIVVFRSIPPNPLPNNMWPFQIASGEKIRFLS